MTFWECQQCHVKSSHHYFSPSKWKPYLQCCKINQKVAFSSIAKIETFLVDFSTTCESFWIKYDVMSLQMSISIDWWCYYLLLQVWWTSFDFFKMDGYQISFQFQVGLVRDRVTVDSASLNLKSIKSKACDFICEKFPQNGLTRLDERILLFKHDYKSTNILQVSIWKSTFLMTIHYSKTQFLSKNSTFETTHKIFFTQFWFSILRNLDTKMTFI